MSRRRAVILVFLLTVAFFVVSGASMWVLRENVHRAAEIEKKANEQTTTQNTKAIEIIEQEKLIESPNTGHEPEPVEVIEEPEEAALSVAEIVASIGTDKERECFGYDFSYVCRVLMQEAGGNSRAYQKFVATIMANDHENEGGRFTMEEIMHEYGYAKPYDWASDEVIQTAVDVFLMGERSELAADALYLYSPQHMDNGWSEWHEQQTFVAEMEGARAFK